MFKGLKSLEEAIAAGAKGAPVETWNPAYCGQSGMRIDGSGRWFHMGSEIRRPQLVALFASVLKREGAEFFLVTPHEKLAIEVEDAPFLISDVRVLVQNCMQVLQCITSLGQGFQVGAEHPLKLFDGSDGFKIYAHVRSGLYGVCTRAVCLAVSDRLEHRGDQLGLMSAGLFFPVKKGRFTLGDADEPV